jgi:NADPH:quinone reductase-like Zn-dependent oxidoreductase
MASIEAPEEEPVTTQTHDPCAHHGATAAGEQTMRAVLQDRYGTDPHEVLHTGTTPRPEPGAGEVLVRVHAAAVDQGTWHLMAGLPYPVRVAGSGLRRPKQPIPGLDVAGVVDAVDPSVTSLAVGDEVYGTTRTGSFAEWTVTEADRLAIKPAEIGWAQAAIVPVSGLTGLQAVRDKAQVVEGDEVLVLGAAGGVGSYAVQVAAALGAQVTGVASTPKLDLVRSLGAEHVVDYTSDTVGGDGQRYDAIIDTGGNRSLQVLRALLRPKGRLVIVGGETDGRWLGGVDRQLRALLWSPFVSQHLGSLISSENTADLDELRRLIDAGDIEPPLDRIVDLNDVPAALHDLRGGRVTGKLAVCVRP